MSTYIAPILVSDPAVAYQEFTANLAPNEKYSQTFDYNTVEVPAANFPKRLEESFPNSTVLGVDGDITSNEPGQGSLGCCGTVANICALASVPTSFAHSLENCIYPTEVSSHGLYFVRVADPDNFLATKWVAIDSNVSATENGKSEFIRLKDGDALAPALFLKAAATMRGGTYDAISNSDPFKKSFSWYPSTTVKCGTFADFADAISNGGVYIFSLTQQYDASGIATTPLGVVYGHAFSAPETLFVSNPDGTATNLVRMSNPWGGGSDYQSEYSEGSQFWVDHPELADKLAVVSRAGGEYWVSWEQFKTLTGRTTFDVTMPLPLATHAHTKNPVVYVFDETTAITPPYTAQLCALATKKNDLTTIQVTAPTNLILLTRWLDGSGARNYQIKFANMSNTFVVQTSVTNSAALGTQSVTLQAGTYKMLPCTQNMMVDRGSLEITIMSDLDIVLARNGATL